MRTPTEYTKNIRNNIITEQMLSDALYSFNKRAKNKRDSLRHIRSYRYSNWQIDAGYDKMASEMENLYQKKSEILDFFKPICVHKQHIEWYDYHDNHHEKYLYFAYYIIGNRGFHQPLDDGQTAQSFAEEHGVAIESIDDDFVTFGKEVTELMSLQFANKVHDKFVNDENVILKMNEHPSDKSTNNMEC